MDSRTVSVPALPTLDDGEFAYYSSVARVAGVREFNLEFLRKVVDLVDVGDYSLTGISDTVWLVGVLPEDAGKVARSLIEHGDSFTAEKLVMTLKMAALKEAADNESNCR